MFTRSTTDRTSRRLVVPAIFSALAVLCAAPAGAQSVVTLVEEHWEMQVADPDSGSSAPQVSMVMSPLGDSSSTFFMFTLNHQSASGYEPGGLQVQQWDGGELVDAKSGHESGTLSTASEVVTWVQRLELHDGQLTFGIHNGSSTTWGSFGGSDLSLSASSSLTALNSYRPAVSLTESHVGFAENRVGSLVLKKLVWVTDDGEVHEQNAPIPLDTSLE